MFLTNGLARCCFVEVGIFLYFPEVSLFQLKRPLCLSEVRWRERERVGRREREAEDEAGNE